MWEDQSGDMLHFVRRIQRIDGRENKYLAVSNIVILFIEG
jgi:hypothetical protein